MLRFTIARLGATYGETQKIILAAYGDDLDIQALGDAWTAHFLAGRDLAPIELKPGIAELLQRLQELNIPMAAATANQREICESSLSDCGVRQYFGHLVCTEDVRNSKPAPDPYLLAAEKLGKQPNCWAVEDSDIGTRAAVASKMRTFQIPDARPPSESVLALGHEVLASASELPTLLSEPES